MIIVPSILEFSTYLSRTRRRAPQTQEDPGDEAARFFKMSAKAAKKSGKIIGRLRTYIPAGKASASPPLGPQLGQVVIFLHASL